jgi:hypothetical protein
VKTQKSHIEKGQKANPFIKMIEDKKRIVSAIRNGKDLSKLKDINFVSPL